jgi:hypothetical protein
MSQHKNQLPTLQNATTTRQCCIPTSEGDNQQKKMQKKSSVALPLHLSNLPTFPSRLQRHSFKGLDTKGFTIGRLDLEASA